MLQEEETANKRIREAAAKREASNRESEAKLERSRKEWSMGPSFDGCGGRNNNVAEASASSTIAVAPTKISKAAPSTGGTAAHEASASSTIAAAPTEILEAAPSTGGTAAPVLSAARVARAAGSADDRLVPGSSGGSSSSSRSSNDNARKDNSWRDATCAGTLLRTFDPGKRCLQRMWRRIK